jgi:three-Cys-motif partner protein
MSDDFFDIPFTEDTNVKLEFYRDYLTKWLPVFIAAHRPFRKTVNIFDFFCGRGKDSVGTLGSPLIALDVLRIFDQHVNDTEVNINLYFNDVKSKYIEELKENILKFGYNDKIQIHFLNEDFVTLLPKMDATFKNSANLIFMDQFGVKYINAERFNQLIHLKVTDIIFFVSSSTFNRFHNDPNVTDGIGITSEMIKSGSFYNIHRTVHKRYCELIPSNLSYCLAQFSIKKGSNIYGLIFGSSHPLGVEKFLEICWDKDKLTGDANFDIAGEIELTRYNRITLFPEIDGSRKIPSFQRDLKELILSGKLRSDLEIYVYGINNGFIGRHIKPVVEKLKKEKKISIKHPSFNCRTVWKRDREPRTITINE